jgi:purine nucleosidase
MIPKQTYILDTDIGDDIDDAYALALLLTAPNIVLRGVTTCFGATDRKAELTAKLLNTAGRGDIPVHAGRRSDRAIGPQHDWAKGFRSRAMRSEDAVSFLKREIERVPGTLTLIAVGPLTNLGDLLTRHPEIAPKVGRIVLMGGSVYAGYNPPSPPAPEWNIKGDVPGARTVFTSGIPLVVAGLDVTAMLTLDAERQKRIYAAGTPLTDALAALTVLWGNGTPILYDAMAVAWAWGERFCESERLRLEVSDDGMTRPVPGPPNAEVLVRPRKDDFLNWFVSILARPNVP